MNSIRAFKRVAGYGAVVVFLAASIHTVEAQVTKTWNGSVNTDWFNPTNWTPAGVPASIDTVNFNSGAISFIAPVTISGQFNWSGGTLDGNPLTIATNGVMNLIGSGGKFLQNTLTNAGAITFAGSGDLTFYNNLTTYKAAIYNLAGALFDIQADRNLTCGCYGKELFNNAGLLRKSAGAGTASFGIAVTNTGTITTLQGTLNFNNGGFLGGTYNAAAGSVINFSGGAFTYQANALPQLNGPGGTRFSGGTLTLIDNLIPNLTLAAGTLTLGPNFQGGTITNLSTGSVLSGNYAVSGLLTLSNGVSGNLQLLSGSTVNWGGGDLTGTNQVGAGAVMNWSAGTLLGPLTVTTSGVMNLVGSGAKYLEHVLTNAGTVNFAGSSDLSFYNNLTTYKGAIYNLGGGLFDIQTDRNFTCGCYGKELFNNAGLLRKSAGSGITSFGITVTNTGTVTSLQGTLNFNSGGFLGGTYNAAAGSVINFSGGAFSYQANALPQLNGPGAIRFTGGTLTLVDNLIPNLSLAGGTLTLGPNFQGGTITNLATGSVLSGNYSVNGLLTVSNGASGNLQILGGSTVNWSGGDLTGTNQVAAGAVMNWGSGELLGPLTVAANGVLNLVGSGAKYVEHFLTNAGTINFAGSTDLSFYNNLTTYKGAIYNLGGGLFDIQTDRNFTCGCYGKELFNNAGLLRKSAGAGTTSFGITVTNTGTITTLQGTLNFNSGGFLGGTYNAAAGSVINFGGGAFSYQANALPQLNGPGETRFSGGTLTLIDNLIPNLNLAGGTLTLGPNFQGGTITNLATGSVLSGNYSVNGLLTVSNGASGNLQILGGSTVNWNGGELSGTNQVGAGAVLNWSSGTLLGPLTVATNGVMNLVGSGVKYVENVLTNAGTIAFGGSGDLSFYNNLTTYKGVLYNLAGALFDIQVDRNFSCGCYGNELFDNAGVLRKSGGTGISGFSIQIHNSGILDVERGTVNFNLNSGYAQTGGTMLFGVSATNSAGHVTLAGSVNFDGTLAINPLNGYTPQNGDLLPLITYGSRTGIFNNVNLPPLSSGLGWQTTYTPTTLQLKVASNGAVAAQITGSVTDNASQGVANLAVFAYTTNASGSFYVSTTTGAGGSYSLNVSNGTWIVGLKDLPTHGYNPVANQIATVNGANQVVNFALQPFSGTLYTITTAVNPPGAGTSGGDGTYPAASSVLVTATANTNLLPYYFASWTENGVFQSANSSYQFAAQRSRQLVANFALPAYTIAISNNPAGGGIVSGAGTNLFGTTNTLIVQPNFGYTFKNWTENGVVLGTNLTLSTIVYSNHFIVANYAEANLLHVVTTVTTPAGITNVSGAGTYTNGQPAVFTAPAAVLSPPNLYTFQKFTLSNNVVTSSTSFNKTFATTDPTNLQYVAVYKTLNIVPQLAAASANYASPAPATTNLLLSFQFDRSMQPGVVPVVFLTNSAAVVQPTVSTNGHWATSVFANDTYVTPGITLATGMDGTNRVFISGAMDLNGYTLALTNPLDLAVDVTFPVLSSIGATPGVQTALITWASSEPATSLVEYGLTTNYGSTTSLNGQLVTLHNLTLNGLAAQTAYHFRVHSHDRAGNDSISTDGTFTTANAPDLLVNNLHITGSLSSGSSLVIAWNDTNSGAGATYTYWYDQVIVTNATTGQTLLNSLVNYDADTLGNIGSGQSANRSVGFTLPNGSAGAGNLLITVKADAGGRIAEYNPGGTAELNNTNSFAVISALAAYADLAVTNVRAPASVSAGQNVEVVWTDGNAGNADATNSWNDQVFLSNTNVPGGGQFLSTFTMTNPLAIGQSVTITQTVTIPQFATGTNWFIVKGNAGNSFYELNTANNSSVATQAVVVSSALSLSLSPGVVSESAGTNAITGFVTRNGDVSSPLTVNLASATGTNVLLPASVNIPAGKYSANFKLSVLDNAVSGGSVTETVFASAAGVPTANASVTILFDDSPALTLTLSASQVQENAGAGVVTGTIQRNVNLGTPLKVTLISDSPTALTAPMSVTIPGGQAGVSFPLTPVDDLVVGDTRRARISARATGYNAVTALLDVLNADASELKLSLADTTVPKGKPSPATIGTVTRSVASPAAQDVVLNVTNNSLVTVPGIVTIPPNAVAANFNVSVGDDNLATGTKIATLTAQMLTPSHIAVTNGQTSATLTVLDTHGPSLSMSFAASSIAKGSNTVGTITRNTTTSSNLSVSLSASPAAAVTFPPDLTIPIGQASATFSVTGVLDNTFTGPRNVGFTAAAGGFNSAVGNLTVSDIYMPDLVPTSVNALTNALTGQVITLNWVVANQGLSAATNSWYDVVYLATDRVGSSQVALAYVTNKTSLASGGSYTNQATFALPIVPGTYWFIVGADALNTVTEINKRNNSLVATNPIAINPLYSAAISNVTPALAKSGTPITFTGRTYFTADGSPAPFKSAAIHLVVNDARRVFTVNSDASGNFSYTFQPLSSEAGEYTVGANYPLLQADPAQASFALLGMQALPGGLTAQLLPNVPLTNQLVLSNLTSHPLTGLAFAAPDLGTNLSVQFILSNQNLPANGAMAVSYVLQSPITRSAQVRFSAIANTAEGAQLTIPVSANVVPLVPQLIANPSFLTRGMLVGAQTVVSFEILNTGGASSGDLTVQLPPSLPWMTLSSPAIVPSIPAGGRATVTLTLIPPANLPLTLYTGSLAAVGEGTGISVPFQFRAVSDGKGDLRVTVTDDYTYYVAGAPKVTNAVVTVRDAFTTAIIAQTNSDANGIAYFSGLPEGPYTVDGTAPKHNQFRGSVSVVTGTATDLEAFMPRQLVTYQWTVVPTEIQDHYTVQLETVFETEVPVPNVVVEEPSVMLLVTPGEMSQFDIKLTNQGLIAANGVTLTVPDDPNYIITPLTKDIGVIPAKSSVTVPVTVQSRAAPASLGKITKLDGGGCDTTQIGFHGCLPNIPLGVEYYYVCGPNNVLQRRSVDLSVACTAKSIKDCLKDLKGVISSENLRSLGCNTLSAFLSCAASQYGIDLDPCIVMGINIACGAVTEGAAGALSGGLGSLPDCICKHLDLIPLPTFPHATPTGGGGDLLLPILPTGSYAISGTPTATGILIPGGNCSSGPGLASLKTASQIAARSNPLKLRGPIKTATGGVCARVRLRIEQNVIITRSAFQGTLEIDNGGSADISNVQISLNFQDSTNGNAAGKFFIEGPVVRGLTAVDGTGILPGGASGSAVYTFIPTVDAAPEAPQSFQIGGTLSYLDNGEQVVVPLLSAPITVYPEARLNLIYFQQRDVYGDDPFTDEIEPSEPFALGLIVKNTGAGKANNLTITSGQPRIVDNEKGLLIDFTIIGTEVGDQPVSPSLTARLGDIAPGGAREVTWDMISSLQGRFLSFDATFKHANELGGTNTSIINSIEIHELTHRVLANRPGDDNLPDFLVNDIADPDNLPDLLYLSDGTVAPVAVSTLATVDGPAGAGHLRVQLAAAVTNGWNYIQVPDPGVGYRLRQVVRSDGKIISLTNNAWTTDRSFPSSTTGAIQENLLHIFDYAGSGSYSLYYASTNTTPPAITQVVGPTPYTQSGAVSSVDVIFSALIDTNTFSYTNVTLTRNGGANLISGGTGISLALVSNLTYSINGLQNLTAADGNYQITVYGDGIYDLWGNNAGDVSASAAWAKGNSPVAVQSLAPVSPNPRNVPLDSTTVTFSKAIDAATFNYTDLSLTLNGGANLVNSSILVAQVSPTTFTINGLATLTGAEGSYSLTVNATNINDSLGGGGFGAQSVSWTMLTTPPKVAVLEQLATNPRNIVVQSLNVTFSGPIDSATFDYHDLSLRRDGGVNLITSGVTVSQVSSNVYKVGNLNFAQGYAGTYTFTVNANDIADLAGNTGSGSTNETWTMVLAVPSSPTHLVMAPDLGQSATDGLTSATTITMSGSVGASNLTVRVFDQTTATDLGAATVIGTNFNATLNFTILGHHQLKFTAVDLAGNVSVPTYFDLFLDIVPPNAVIQQVASPIYASVSNIGVTFSEPLDLNTLAANNFVLTRNGTNSMTPTLTHVATNFFLLGGLSSFTAPFGAYQLTLNLAGIQDPAGNSSTNHVSMAWVRGSLNVAPALDPVTNWVVAPNRGVRFNATANDANGDLLTFSLEPGAPAQAKINSTNGLFTWVPSRAYASTTNPITIRVSDNGDPAMSATRTFVVTVLDYLDLSLGSTNVEVGQSVSVPILLASSEGVTNLTFNIAWPGARFTNPTLSAVAPEIAPPLLQDQATNLLITISTTPGQVLQGAPQQQILALNFTAAASQASGFVPLTFGPVDATKPGSVNYSNYVTHPANISVIQDQPLLMAGFSPKQRQVLTLLGRVNESYQLQFSTNLSGAWYPLMDYVQTNSAITISLTSSNPVIFYRVHQR